MSNTRVFLFYKSGGRKGFVVNFSPLNFYIVLSSYYYFTVIENYDYLLKQGNIQFRHSVVFCHQLFFVFLINADTSSIDSVLYLFVSCYYVTSTILLRSEVGLAAVVCYIYNISSIFLGNLVVFF